MITDHAPARSSATPGRATNPNQTHVRLDRLPEFDPNTPVKVTDMGGDKQITILPRSNVHAGAPSAIRKLNADTYLDVATGEVKHYKHAISREQSLKSLYQTITRLNQLITTNFRDSENEVMLTLTYRPDLKRRIIPVSAIKSIDDINTNQIVKNALRDDIGAFTRKLKAKHNSTTRQLMYLWVLQPHASGVMHFHVLLKYTDNTPLNLNKHKLEALWGKGFINIKPLTTINHVGAYLSSFMLNDTPDPDNPDKPTRYARLKYYPPNMRIYSGSQNLKRPTTTRTTYGEAQELVGNQPPTYASMTSFKAPNGKTYRNFKAWYESPETPSENHPGDADGQLDQTPDQ